MSSLPDGWQQGGVENANGSLPRYLPRKTDLHTVPTEQILHVFQTYNNTHRKGRGYRTPAEVYSNQLLPLNCEPTVLAPWLG